MTRVRRRGWTVVEVLVALAVFALLAAATAGVLTTALRLQAEAGRVAQRVAAFGPAAAGLDATGTGTDGTSTDGTGGSAPPSCAEASDGQRSEVDGAGEPCLDARTRCHVTAGGDAVCDGRGPLLRSDWSWSGHDGGSAPSVTSWRWAP